MTQKTKKPELDNWLRMAVILAALLLVLFGSVKIDPPKPLKELGITRRRGR